LLYDLGEKAPLDAEDPACEDSTGREIERALSEKASLSKNIRIYENYFSIDLIMRSKLLGLDPAPEDRCIGPTFSISIKKRSTLFDQNSLFWRREAPEKSISSHQS